MYCYKNSHLMIKLTAWLQQLWAKYSVAFITFCFTAHARIKPRLRPNVLTTTRYSVPIYNAILVLDPSDAPAAKYPRAFIFALADREYNIRAPTLIATPAHWQRSRRNLHVDAHGVATWRCYNIQESSKAWRPTIQNFYLRPGFQPPIRAWNTVLN